MKARQATELDRLFARFDRARDERLTAALLRRRPAARPRAEAGTAKPAKPRARARFVLFALLLGVLAVVLALLTRSRAARST